MSARLDYCAPSELWLTSFDSSFGPLLLLDEQGRVDDVSDIVNRDRRLGFQSRYDNALRDLGIADYILNNFHSPENLTDEDIDALRPGNLAGTSAPL